MVGIIGDSKDARCLLVKEKQEELRTLNIEPENAINLEDGLSYTKTLSDYYPSQNRG